MALKRLDEEFELKPGTQLLPYMKRLLPSLEGRFQELESANDLISQVTEEIRAAALLRMNEILIPATKDIIAVTKLGFLLGPCSQNLTLVMGYMTFVIDEGPQRTSFTPSPYLIIEHSVDDYAIARTGSYTQKDGLLEVTVTAIHGNPGPHSSWMISSTPGMADSTKIYHDAVGPMHDTVVTDHAEIVTMHQEILDAAQALEDAGLDAYAFIRRDGTVDFTAVQKGVHPAVGSNDNVLATTAWSRARMQEYVGQAMQRTGDTMSGPLTLFGNPVQPLHAATKQYVDAIIGQGGTMTNVLTIRTSNPSLRLQSLSTNEDRMIEALSVDGVRRWVLSVGDSAPLGGGNSGANFSLLRYNDGGSYLDTALTVNRQTGATYVKALNYSGGLAGQGNLDVMNGDITTYRAGSAGTGIMWMNQAHSAYHHWDGGNHVFVGGGLTTNGAALNSGAINCNALSTQGWGATVWGMTCHGSETINGNSWINGTLIVGGGNANYIHLDDNDWGRMSIHHNNDLIGFLSNGGGWVMYTTNAGHMWTPQYGWIHDYVNNTAYSHAVNQANAYVQNRVSNGRLVHAGDFGMGWNQQWVEPGNTVCTGLWSWYAGGQYIIMTMRSRYIQLLTTGWFTIGYA